MKRLLACTLFSLVFVLFFSSIASADIMPGNSHSLNRCVKVVNLDEFSDIVLMSYVTGPMIASDEINQINTNECITKGYKFNSLSIYWNIKDKLNVIDPNNLLLENVEVYGGYVDDKNPLVKEDIEYTIKKISDGKYSLYKSKLISEYNDGTPKKVETFDSTSTSSSSKLVKRGFWQTIVCFFKGLFGNSC